MENQPNPKLESLTDQESIQKNIAVNPWQQTPTFEAGGHTYAPAGLSALVIDAAFLHDNTDEGEV